jgi:hypothetical protein
MRNKACSYSTNIELNTLAATKPVLQMFSLLHFADLVARFFPGGAEGGSNKKWPGSYTVWNRSSNAVSGRVPSR